MDLVICELIGKGAHGSVYSCKDGNGTKYALKRVSNSEQYGCICLLECSILSSILHPNLSHAISISTFSHYTDIVLEMAKGDLEGMKVEPTYLKENIFQVCSAIACLHKEQIVHGDIKAANILVYENDNVKLSDFSLSQRVFSDTLYRDIISTPSHRPPEVWMKKGWNMSVDMWSLGCTIYEMVYGRSLFGFNETIQGYLSELELFAKVTKQISPLSPLSPSFSPLSPPLSPSFSPLSPSFSPLSPSFSPSTSLSSFNKLFNLNEEEKKEDSQDNKKKIEKKEDEREKEIREKEIREKERREINEIILSLLRIDPSERPTIFQLLSHNLFKDCMRESYLKYVIPESSISTSSQERAYDFFRHFFFEGGKSKNNSESQIVEKIRMSIEIFKRLIGMKIKESDLLFSIIIIVSKIISKSIPKISVNNKAIMKVEVDILTRLSYRVHIL
jgi:serine/threonine protein kinase